MSRSATVDVAKALFYMARSLFGLGNWFLIHMRSARQPITTQSRLLSWGRWPNTS